MHTKRGTKHPTYPRKDGILKINVDRIKCAANRQTLRTTPLSFVAALDHVDMAAQTEVPHSVNLRACIAAISRICSLVNKYVCCSLRLAHCGEHFPIAGSQTTSFPPLAALTVWKQTEQPKRLCGLNHCPFITRHESLFPFQIVVFAIQLYTSGKIQLSWDGNAEIS